MAEAHYVLVADGDPLALAATAGVLEDAGFRVTRAADCAGVLFQARARHPSLVLLGENLPGTGGIGALRQIRDDPALESVSVVMLGTRGAAPERHDDALDAGADGHILRPLPNASLLARVRAHLRQRERIDGYRASEAKARKLIDRQADAVLVVDCMGVIQFANRVAGELFGQPPAGLAGMPFGFPVEAGCGASEVQELDIIRRGRMTAVTEMRVLSIDWEGQQAWVATLRDITGRRAAEMAVRESRALLDMASSVARLGAWSFDCATRTRLWSDSARAMLGVAPGATLRLSQAIAMVAPEHRATVRNSFAACLRDGTPYDIEAELTTLDGRRIHVRSLGEALREDGRIVRVQGAFQDNTNLKLAEQSVARGERRFRELTEAMPIVVWTATPGGMVDYINSRFFDYTGIPAGAPPETCWRQALPPEDLDSLGQPWAHAVRTGDPFEIEYRIRRGSDRSFRWHVVRAVAIRDEAGAIAKWYGTAMDIHEARLMQEEARRLLERAERANRAKSRFLAGMSHELRTPLSGIIGYAQLLQLDGGLNAHQAARVQAMLDAGAHLLEMINCVLDISQIEADRLDLHPCPMDPRTSALACLDLIRHAGETKGLELRFTVAPDVPRQILADPTRLRQVLLNLLGNAVKFTASGSVGLSLETAMDGARLLVSVTDTGPGVSAGFRGRLFQDFDRLGADAEGVVEGAGLGLALSARLAALMGGSLVHGDNPGGGSVFWLDMPLTAAEEPQARPAEPGAARRSERPLRLLIVDDVDMNRNIANAFLREGGHQAVCVGSGAEAVAEAAGGGYDAILMDVRMPGMDGLEATRRIRALPGPCGLVPVIAVTAQVFAEQIDDCRRAGMDSHLGKPFSQAALLEAVARAAPMEDRNGGISLASNVPADKADGSVPPVAEKSGEPVFDRDAFGRTAAFLAPDAVARHLQSLAAQGHDILHCLRGPPAMPASACGDLVDAAHSLGGSAGLFGFRLLLSCARAYEAAAEEESPETMAALCALGAAIDASLPHMLGMDQDAS